MLHHHPDFLHEAGAERRAAVGREAVEDPGAIERLLTAAAAGDERAWSALVQRFSSRIRAVARAHRLVAADVDGVVQTTWLRLLTNIDQVRDPAGVGAWLATTARRESLRTLRRAGRERPTDDEQVLDRPVADRLDERLVREELVAAVLGALAGLPDRHGRLMRLLMAEPARSYAEISAAAGVPIGSIGPIRRRSLARLRQDDRLRIAAGADR